MPITLGVLFLAVVIGVVYYTNIKMSYSPRGHEDILEEINNKNELAVFVLGNLNFPEELKKELSILNIGQKDLEGKVLSEENNKSIRILIISTELLDFYLDKKGFELIRKILDKNVAVYFRTSNYDDSRKLQELTRDDLVPKAEVIGRIENHKIRPITDLAYVWVAKSKSGKYTGGEGYFQDNFSEEQILQRMILNGWRWHSVERNSLNGTSPNYRS